MKFDRINMTVQGQKTGEARLTAYLLDPVSVSPQNAGMAAHSQKLHCHRLTLPV